VWWLVRSAPPKLTSLGIGFLIGGALGNALDRARIGVVIDFLDLSRVGFRWVFNLADAAVDVGIGFLLLGIAIGVEPGKKSSPIR
jgi:signal peptidase II